MAVQYDYLTLFSGTYIYPNWAKGVEFMIVGLCLVCIPGWMIYQLIRDGLFRRNFFKIVKESVQPTADWKPALLEDQTGRYAPENFTPTLGKSATSSNAVLRHDPKSVELTGITNRDGENVFVTESSGDLPSYDNVAFTKEEP
jgi:hypothetical protein